MLSLLRLERKQTNSSNPFRIRIFLFLSYSFGIETINTFIHSVAPSNTIPDSRPKWAKCKPVFGPKRRKNPTRWGGTYLYDLYKGIPPGYPFPSRLYSSVSGMVCSAITPRMAWFGFQPEQMIAFMSVKGGMWLRLWKKIGIICVCKETYSNMKG